MTKKKHLFWFRRDLRLHDNRGLAAATADKDVEVLPVFIFDTKILSQLKNRHDRRITFIYESLLELQENIRHQGGELIVIIGDPVDEIPALVQQYKIDAVYTNRDYEPYAKKRDASVAKKLEKQSSTPIPFYTSKDHVIWEKQDIRKDDGTSYRVFTPYKKAWLKKLELYPMEMAGLKSKQNKWMPGIKVPLPSISDLGFERSPCPITAGEKSAQKQWKKFWQQKCEKYDQQRDFPALEGTSQLSVHLRFGTLSIRELVSKAYTSEGKGEATWLSELIWREFYQMLLDEFPRVTQEPFLTKYKSLHFPNNKDLFELWCQGQTGFPLIDAAMRCFSQTGMMHNRLRMVVASFLVKTLLIDWRWGEKYFAQNLLDFDLAANNGGWQWCASVGCDAQPYFRIFNPITQSQKFDSNGHFIRQYCPELKNFDNKHIHAPWLAKEKEQEKCYCLIGRDYPFPIVDYSQNRLKALTLYKL